jgi:hypothetical protein
VVLLLLLLEKVWQLPASWHCDCQQLLLQRLLLLLLLLLVMICCHQLLVTQAPAEAVEQQHIQRQ